MGLCASVSKTSGEVLQSFYYKMRGRGVYTVGGGNYGKLIKIIGQAEFTTLRGRSNTGHSVY